MRRPQLSSWNKNGGRTSSKSVRSSRPRQEEFRREIDSSAARAFALSGLPIYVASTRVGSIHARFGKLLRSCFPVDLGTGTYEFLRFLFHPCFQRFFV